MLIALLREREIRACESNHRHATKADTSNSKPASKHFRYVQLTFSCPTHSFTLIYHKRTLWPRQFYR